jgi:chitosanase
MDSEIKNLLRSIINAFETDTKETNYTTIYIYHDGPDKVRQITLGFGITEYGNLKELIQTYIKKNGKYSAQFQQYVSEIGKTSLVNDAHFKDILIKSAQEDSLMRESEDEIYDKLYWEKTFNWFTINKFKINLSMGVILDSYVHSGSILGFLRDKFKEKVPAAGGNEKKWISAYIKTRRDWLANHSNPILRGTVYRADFFGAQIHNDNWDLKCPLVPHGVKIC